MFPIVPYMKNDNRFTEDIRVRVPKAVRDAFDRLLEKNPLKKESELFRDALVDYLAKQGESIFETAPNSPEAVEPFEQAGERLAENLHKNAKKRPALGK